MSWVVEAGSMIEAHSSTLAELLGFTDGEQLSVAAVRLPDKTCGMFFIHTPGNTDRADELRTRFLGVRQQIETVIPHLEGRPLQFRSGSRFAHDCA